jgi:hypothetical protein
MNTKPWLDRDDPAPLAVALPVALLLVGALAYLRLVVYPDAWVPLSQGLVLMPLFWHRRLVLH